MRHAVALAVAVLLFAAGSLSAATFEPVSDAALLGKAELVVRARVLDSVSRLRADGVLVTDTRLAIDEVLKGRAVTEVLVSEIGGAANGTIMIVPGSPEYRTGSRVLAFLKQRPDGTWFTSHMGLGHFRFTPQEDGPELLARVDTGIEVDDETAFRPRRADEFLKWVRGSVKGVRIAEATLDSAAHGKLVPATNAASSYVLTGGSPVRPIRWEGCELGCLIPFFYNGSQPGVSTLSGLEAAADAWTNDPDSFLNIGIAGTSFVTNVSSGNDNENTIVLNNTASPSLGFCDAGLGCGIVWASTASTHTFDGSTFYSALEADVIIRPGTYSQNFFAALVAHELGHAIALKHAPSGGALMSSSIPTNATPTLKAWDMEAMAEVYGEGFEAPCNPPVISGTNGGGTVPYGSTRQLSVNVSGTGPFNYQWFRGTSPNNNDPVGSGPTFTTPEVIQPLSYWVRITSPCSGAFADSPTITVTPEACDDPSITQQPENKRIEPGQTTTLTVAGAGTNLEYRWYEAGTAGDTTKLVGTAATFTTPVLQSTTSYWARVFNACGEAYSRVAVVTVAPAQQCIAPSIVSQPSGVTIPLGQGVTLAVTAAGDAPLSYQWYRGDAPNESDPVAGGTSSTLILPPFTTAGSHKYWVKVSNTCPQSQPARSNTITITVQCDQIVTPEISAPPAVPASSPYDVQWTGILANTSSFELQEATDAGFTQNLRTFTITDALKRTIPAHSEITTDTRFFYRVRATNRCTNQATSFSRTVSTVVTAPQPANSREFSLSIPNTITQPVTQDYLVPGFGASATNGDTFSITIDQPWLTVFPQTGALSAGGTTVRFTIAPTTLGVGSTNATVIVTRTQPAAARGPVAQGSSSVALPFTVSKTTPVTPDPRDAEPPAGTLIIPAIAHADGIGTRFQSDVRIANVSASPIEYEITFTPSFTNGLDNGKKTVMSIASGETKGLDDIVKAWYGSGLLGESGIGTLEIRPITPDAGVRSTIASSRTYAVTDAGTLGQFLPAFGLNQFVGNIAQDSLNRMSLQQVANSETYRTNVGFVEGSGHPAEITLRLLDGNNNLLKEVNKSIAPFAHEQISVPALFGDIPFQDGRIEVTVNSSTGKVTSYASVVDNKTSDPLAVLPAQAQRLVANKYTVPGVAELNNPASNFHTDMRIYNASNAPVTVALSYYPQGSGTPIPANQPITIPAGHVKAIDNVLPTLWGLTATGGSVVADAPADSSLVLTARTFSRTENGGTYGQFIPGVTRFDSIGVGDRTQELLQLEQSDQYRTNVGLVETTGKPVHVEITAESPQSKTTLKTDIHLQPHEYRQYRLFSELGFANNVYNGRVTVRVLDGEGRVAVFGSVIDNRTADPTYVPAQ